ncbi:Cilia- and flagella-associated protein 61 [Frankliniella fusca]|uniref:Cilia- and flagella-associated protein 61 n=1 Tax=Frankliniella fusca TaxID=407009 RepID=A0AAE1GXZ1_9NEOP|nr:Cilia- and flagella-associated protein 61 [Frankliniella fusca]
MSEANLTGASSASSPGPGGPGPPGSPGSSGVTGRSSPSAQLADEGTPRATTPASMAPPARATPKTSAMTSTLAPPGEKPSAVRRAASGVTAAAAAAQGPSATGQRAQGRARRDTPRGSVQSTPVHSSRGSGSYEPLQMMGVEGPPVAFWRPTEPRDVPRILALAQQSDAMALFGEVEDIPVLLERCVLALSQLNVLGEVVACLCLSTWPACPAVHPAASPEWLAQLYDLDLQLAAPASTLLVRLLVWDARYMVTCAHLLLYSVFVTLPALDQVVVVVPPKTPPNEVLWRLFDEELAKGFKSAANLQSLLVCPREALVRALRVREADCEDNDDLLRIFDQSSFRLRQLYGDFYITELITNPESRKILVAEEPKRRGLKQQWDVRPRVIGVMVLNTDVNLALLNAHFQLVPFYGLRQPHPRDQLNLPGWAKPRPELEQALRSTQQQQQQPEGSSDDGGGGGSPRSRSDESPGPGERAPARSRTRGRTEGLAARAARLEAEALERRRRRWTGGEHYLSELSLTREEREEPNDPFRLADVTWANVQPDIESIEESDSSSMDNDDRLFKFHRKKKVRVRTRSEMMVLASGTLELLPEFKGVPNAFLVELFAMHEHFDERLAFDFLVAAFCVFPELDYCTLTVPHAYPTFPLLDHFVRVAPREKRNFSQELYVAHRTAVFGELEVREAESKDLPDILQLIKTLKRDLELVLREVQAGLGEHGDHQDWLTAYVACWQDQVVGVAVISDEDDWEYMACHYMVEALVDVSLLSRDDHGGLRACVLSPVFQQRAGAFLRELHRLSAKTCLYYALYPRADLWRREERRPRPPAAKQAEADELDLRFLHPEAPAAAEPPAPPLPGLSVPSVLDELMPVAPRFQNQTQQQQKSLWYCGGFTFALLLTAGEEEEEGEEVLGAAERREPPYSLFLSTPKLLAMPKASVNVRIVVVGASDAALSFLETLVFSSPEVRYNNLTLVSRHGLPGESDLGALADRFLPHRGRYDHRQLARLQLGAWVNVARGAVTGIRRAERLVEVDGRTALPYDYLFLFCGQQLCPPRLPTQGDKSCKHYPAGRGYPAAIGDAVTGSARLQRPEEGAAAPDEETSLSDMSSSLADTSNETADTGDQTGVQPQQQEELPANVLLLNTDVDVRAALALIKQGASVLSDYTVVLYGWWHSPELLCAAAGLLHWGVPARNLLIVDPESPDEEGPRMPSAFGEEEVEAALLSELEGAGVAVCRGCELEGWLCGEPDWLRAAGAGGGGGGRLGGGGGGGGGGPASGLYATHFTFRPKERDGVNKTFGLLIGLLRPRDSEQREDETAPVSVPCLALLCFQPKAIHPVTFSALVASGLVLDGLLVIDRLGRTNDPFILAGGPVTTYQRRLCAADLDHPHYSSLEVGRKLAERMRALWDPLLRARAHVEERTPDPEEDSAAAAPRSATASASSAPGPPGAGAGPQRTLSRSEGLMQLTLHFPVVLGRVGPRTDRRDGARRAGPVLALHGDGADPDVPRGAGLHAAGCAAPRLSGRLSCIARQWFRVSVLFALMGHDQEPQGAIERTLLDPALLQHFLRVRAPGPFPLLASTGEARSLQSGSPGSARYCRVLVDAVGFVRDIVCLTEEPLPVDMLVAAYGQHEDNLDKVADLLEHLSSPDIMGAVYHRNPYRMTQWQTDLDALFGYPSCKIVPAVTAALQSNNWEPLAPALRAQLRLEWSESQEQRAIELRVANLLRDHGFSVYTDEVRQAVRDLLATKEGWK